MATTARISWDPRTGLFDTPAQPGYDTYFTGHSFLSDGELLVTGGHVHVGEPISHTSVYDPFADTWHRVSPMNDGRCYPTNTTLAAGPDHSLVRDSAAARLAVAERPGFET